MKRKFLSFVLVLGLIMSIIPLNSINVAADSMADSIISVAESKIGCYGSDSNEFTHWYYGNNNASAQWCAIFICWCANQVGCLNSYIPRTASCASMKNWFVSNNRYYSVNSGYVPQKGDIVFFSTDGTSTPHHVGFIAKSGVSNGKIYYIDGNTSGDYVKERYMSTTYSSCRTLGYAHPDYGIVHAIDNSYTTPFSATAKCHIDVTNEDHSDPGNYYIDAGDECTIHQVYTDGCCLVEYPISGGTRTYYAKLSDFEIKSVDNEIVKFIDNSVTYDGFTLYWHFLNCSQVVVKIKSIALNTNVGELTLSNDYTYRFEVANSSWGSEYEVQLIPNGDTSRTHYVLYGDTPNRVKLPEAEGTAYFESSSVNLDLSGTQSTNLYLHVTGNVASLAYTNCDQIDYGEIEFNKPKDGVIAIPITAKQTGNIQLAFTTVNNLGKELATATVDVNIVDTGTGTISSSTNSVNIDLSQTKTAKLVLTVTGSVASMPYSLSKSSSDAISIGYQWNYPVSGQITVTITAKEKLDDTIVFTTKNPYDKVLATCSVHLSVTLPSYTVSYNANGGSGAPSSQTKYYNETLTLSTALPTRTNYTFLGWSTNSSATSATYQPGGKYTSNSGATLYAVWAKNDTTKPEAVISSTNDVAIKQTVTIQMSDNIALAGYYWGTSTNPVYTTVSGTSKTITVTVCTNGTYYLFVKDSSGNVYRSEKTFYKTSFDSDGGSLSPTYVITESGKSFSAPKSEKSGYNFKGWVKDISQTNTEYISTITPTSNKTYYAVFEKIITPKIVLSVSSKTMNTGDSFELEATTTPTGQTVTWKSSNTSVATVSSSGVVTAKSAGNAEITAEFTYNSVKYSAKCSVTVNQSVLLGDVNNDGVIDAGDSILISKYDVGLITLDSMKSNIEKAGDVNKDGVVDAGDAILVSKYDAGLISKF